MESREAKQFSTAFVCLLSALACCLISCSENPVQSGGTGSITITSPNGGELLQPGTAVDVEWENNGFMGLITVAIVDDRHGHYCHMVSGLHPSRGKTTWQVPNLPSQNYRIKVYSQDRELLDESDRDFAIDGIYVLIARDQGLQVTNITMPDAPENAGEVMGHYSDALIAHGRCYSVGTNEFRILDLSDHIDIKLVGSIFLDGIEPVAVDVHDYRACIASDSSTFLVVDTRIPSSPRIARKLKLRSQATDVAVLDERAYLANGSSGVTIVDISDPENAQVVDNVLGDQGNASAVAAGNGYIYVSQDQMLRILDVRNAQSVVVVGSLVLPNTAHEVALQGNYAYVANDAAGVSVIDVSNPQLPVLVGSTPFAYLGQRPVRVSAFGNRLVVVDKSSRTALYDTSDPTSPSFLGGYGSSANAALIYDPF